MTGLFDISDRVALVVGGASGLGLAITHAMAAAGARVFFTTRDVHKMGLVQDDALPGSVHGIKGDVSSKAGVDALVRAVYAATSELHILINNAGISRAGPLDEYDETAFDECFQVNATAPFAVTRGLLPILRACATPGDPTRVVNVGSAGGIRPRANRNYAYTASKAALHMITKHLALDLAADNITVNSIAPGIFATDMTKAMRADPQAVEAALRSVPLRRWGAAQDVAGAVIYLVSPAAGYVTGTVLIVDGGRILQ